ncbi:MAG: lipopolysaccharide heptosyltransferase II [Phycisphaerae bacterium]|nr:lipopolysaccharide heptosyltransferase II [Phycisphaerae bacterium]
MAPPLAEREFERILLIKPSSLGDVTHALPILEGLRKRYPNAHIAWMLGTGFVDLIEGHPALDEIIPFDRKRFGRLGRSAAVNVEFLRYVSSLRRKRFDLAIDLQGLFRSGFFAWVTRAPVRIGPGESREAAWVFYTHRFHAETMESHAVDRLWSVAEMLGFGDEPRSFHLPISPDDRAAARRLLVDGGVNPDEDYAVVFPGARWETKVCPAERFTTAIDHMHEAHHLPVVLAGGRDEEEVCRSVQHACRRHPLNLAGKTTLRQVVALIEGARLVVVNDSGPMHLAGVLGRPLVAVLGPTNPVRTGPYRQPEAVVRLDLPCSPCYLKRLDRCGHGHACMADLDAERILAAIDKNLGHAREA